MHAGISLKKSTFHKCDRVSEPRMVPVASFFTKKPWSELGISSQYHHLLNFQVMLDTGTSRRMSYHCLKFLTWCSNWNTEFPICFAQRGGGLINIVGKLLLDSKLQFARYSSFCFHYFGGVLEDLVLASSRLTLSSVCSTLASFLCVLLSVTCSSHSMTAVSSARRWLSTWYSTSGFREMTARLSRQRSGSSSGGGPSVGGQRSSHHQGHQRRHMRYQRSPAVIRDRHRSSEAC